MVLFALATNLVPAFILAVKTLDILVGIWTKVTKRKIGYLCNRLHKNLHKILLFGKGSNKPKTNLLL